MCDSGRSVAYFTYFSGLFSIFISIMSLFAMPKLDSGSNTAAFSTVYMLKQDLCIYEQRLFNLFSSASDARNSSAPDVLISSSNHLEKGTDSFMEAAPKLIDARRNAGNPYTSDALRSKYHDLLHNQLSAM